MLNLKILKAGSRACLGGQRVHSGVSCCHDAEDAVIKRTPLIGIAEDTLSGYLDRAHDPLETKFIAALRSG